MQIREFFSRGYEIWISSIVIVWFSQSVLRLRANNIHSLSIIADARLIDWRLWIATFETGFGNRLECFNKHISQIERPFVDVSSCPSCPTQSSRMSIIFIYNRYRIPFAKGGCSKYVFMTLAMKSWFHYTDYSIFVEKKMVIDIWFGLRYLFGLCLVCLKIFCLLRNLWEKNYLWNKIPFSFWIKKHLWIKI